MPVSILPGSFGEVRRGRLQPRGRREQAVAIQALWAGGAESLKMTFLGRAALLGQFQHPNILRLEGVVTKSRPVMVLTELMELGPLDSFLRVSSALVKEGLWAEESLEHSHFPEDRALCLCPIFRHGMDHRSSWSFHSFLHHDLHSSFTNHSDSQICPQLASFAGVCVAACLPC